ncbi:hypothetical protein KEM52_004067 [Ascosphaera acerosa]|nr:hypothetical protein KEM52_004067 [Ascosphaera acerosa]
MPDPAGPLTKKVTTGSPYQLDGDQITRAAAALLKHMKSDASRKALSEKKPSLLSDSDSDDDAAAAADNDVPIWLIVTTKKHIVDKSKLKPGKIAVPHSLNDSESLRVCLITADPQRAVKDTVAHAAFPPGLARRITRVIGFSKLRAKYHTYESRRKLLAEHDVFLADDRICNRLPDALGKTFYKGSRRPIPISIAEVQKKDGKRMRREERTRNGSGADQMAVAAPGVVAKEIERALQAVPVHLAPAATTAVRVGRAGFTAQQVRDNVQAVVKGLTERFITRGWRNVKGIHIKGPDTMSLPVWLASELWSGEEDVAGEADGPSRGAEPARKRKLSTPADEDSGREKRGTAARMKKARRAEDDSDAETDSRRRAKLQQQKAKLLSDRI